MQCTKAIYPHSKYNYVTCTKLVEKFADENPSASNDSGTNNNSLQSGDITNSIQDTTKTASPIVSEVAKGIIDAVTNATQEGINSEVTMTAMETKDTVVAAATDMIEQVKQEHECNKTSLHITIGILVTIVIGLIAYIVYQQMKNKQQ